MRVFGLFKAKKILSLAVALAVTAAAVSTGAAAKAEEAGGSFNILTYNVAGLPAILSSSNPEVNTPLISPKLNDYSIVGVQEDFAYHNQLISQATHAYKTETSGNVPGGDGMNFLSKYSLSDIGRVKWNKSSGVFDNGSDQLTPKGILYASVEIQSGVFIDIYDLHTDAGDDTASYEARRSNITQLSELIQSRSQGRAVIVFGDTNSRYTRSEDNFETALLAPCGLSDAWIQLVRNGSVPADGDALMDSSNRNGPNYEVVDKVFYRSGAGINLTAAAYQLNETKFVNSENGEQLSDHYPVEVTFHYTINDLIKTSTVYGGSGGTPFSFIQQTGGALPTKVAIRSAERLDMIAMTYANTAVASVGGTGGNYSEINLASDEYIISMELCKVKRNGSDRISYIKLTTNKGQVLQGGARSNPTVFTAPAGYAIAGVFGCAGREIDKLGAIYQKLG